MEEGGPLTRQSVLARSGGVSCGTLGEEMAEEPKMDDGEEIEIAIYLSVVMLLLLLFPSNSLFFCVLVMRIVWLWSVVEDTFVAWWNWWENVRIYQSLRLI